MENKIVQAAVKAILTPIYQAEFLGFRYGFRPRRGQRDALDALAYTIVGFQHTTKMQRGSGVTSRRDSPHLG